MTEIAKRFEAQHPGVRIDVQTGGSGKGVSDARQGLSQIGMASRDPKDEEQDLEWFAIGRDGIAIILNRDNPVTALSSDQIRSIYRGEVQNWSQVGGNDAPITVINKDEGRSTLELFLDHFKLKNADVKASRVIGDNLDGIRAVAAERNAIGYVSIGTAEHEAESGTPIKVLGPDGSSATTDAVRNRTYPVMRTLHLLTKGKPTGTVQEIIEFARSPQVRDLVEQQYFVVLGPSVGS